MIASSFRNNLHKTDSIDEPDDSEFWESVPKYPNRRKEMKECINDSLLHRKKKYFIETERSNSFDSSKDHSESEGEVFLSTLTERKQAFFDEAERRNSVRRSSSASDDIDTSLPDRKRAFLGDAERRGSVAKDLSLTDDIEQPLSERMKSLQDETERLSSQPPLTNASDDIDTPLVKRKSDLLNEIKRNETVEKDDSITDDIDRGEIACRRRSFVEMDLEQFQKSRSDDKEEGRHRVRHKVRRINSSGELYELLKKRRVLSATDDDGSDREEIQDFNNNTREEISEITQEFTKLLDNIDSQY